jgi:hypothetical protein
MNEELDERRTKGKRERIIDPIRTAVPLRSEVGGPLSLLPKGRRYSFFPFSFSFAPFPDRGSHSSPPKQCVRCFPSFSFFLCFFSVGVSRFFFFLFVSFSSWRLQWEQSWALLTRFPSPIPQLNPQVALFLRTPLLTFGVQIERSWGHFWNGGGLQFYFSFPDSPDTVLFSSIFPLPRR